MAGMGALMLNSGELQGIPERTANRMMMVRGSGMLLRAIRGEPEPDEPPACLAVREKPRPRKHQAPYIPVQARPTIPAPMAVRAVIDAAAEAFGLEPEQLLGRGKRRAVLMARAVAIRLIRDRTWENGEPRHSTPTIGGYFGRDHSTVCWALEHFETYCRQFPAVGEIYEKLRETVG